MEGKVKGGHIAWAYKTEKPTGFGLPRRHLASLQYWEQTTWNWIHRVTELAFPQIILDSWSPAP